MSAFRKRATCPEPISLQAAALALSALSPDAQRLLMAMIALTASTSEQRLELDDAVRHASLGRASGLLGLAELIDIGLMYDDPKSGLLRLHRLYSGLAQGLARLAADPLPNNDGNIVHLSLVKDAS